MNKNYNLKLSETEKEFLQVLLNVYDNLYSEFVRNYKTDFKSLKTKLNRVKAIGKTKTKCLVCGREFDAYRNTQKYCSEECQRIGSKIRRYKRGINGKNRTS